MKILAIDADWYCVENEARDGGMRCGVRYDDRVPHDSVRGGD